MSKLWLAALLLCSCADAQPVAVLAMTPPMGWSTWPKFGCDIDEDLATSTADALVTSGMREAGYIYLNLDGCWQGGRDEAGELYADRARFPHGIAYLADYAHSRGLKFGIYTDVGPVTCGDAEYPGSLGHEYQDAATFARWGVDYVKHDWCASKGRDPVAAYKLMGDAIAATSRPMVYSICDWGEGNPWLWGASVGGNLWRTAGDLADRWDGAEKWSDGTCCYNGLMADLDAQVGLTQYAKPDHWNDPDLLQVGVGGMSDTEYKTQFSLWAVLAAPLLAGNDVRAMTTGTREILLNSEVITIDQDLLGKQGDRMLRDGDLEMWSRPLQNGDLAVVLLNRGSEALPMSILWQSLGWAGTASVRDLWLHRDMGAFLGGYRAEVEAHGVVMLRLSKELK